MTQIQEKRHEVAALVQEAQEALGGTIHLGGVLRGVPGLSQEDQVARLTEAKDRVTTGTRKLDEAVAAAKTKLAEAITVLDEAIDIANSRDYSAYQAEKSEEQAAEEAHQGYVADDDTDDYGDGDDD